MKYTFKEARLGDDFCTGRIAGVEKLIGDSQSFTVVGMPGMGISIFLRYLVTRDFAWFLHVDLYELPELNKKEFYKKLPSKLKLKQLSSTYNRVVLVFNRFDQLKDEFNKEFFNRLRTLRDVDRERIVFVFSANKPLVETVPGVIDIGNMNMYATSYYLKPYEHKDLVKIIKMDTPDLVADNKLADLSGGHYQLFRLLSKSGRNDNFLKDPFVNIQIKSIYDVFNYQQRLQLKKIARGEKVSNVDGFVMDMGVIDGQLFFSSLLKEYILGDIPLKLSKKEKALLSLLMESKGKVVSKDEIFDALWKGDLDSATDWALNALIYRLRRKLDAGNEYVIESYKRVGYSLNKI